LTVINLFLARLTAGDLHAAHNQIARCVHQVIGLLDDLALFITTINPKLGKPVLQ
jgi:hypothetical protein